MPASDKFVRPLSGMHVIFAISAAALTVATFLMMAADHDDQWRGFQQTFYKLEAEQLRADKQAVETTKYEQDVDALNQQKQQAQEQLEQHRAQLQELQGQADELGNVVTLKSREVRFERAKRDVARANYDLAVRDAKSDEILESLLAAFNTKQSEVEELETELQQQEAAHNRVLQQIGEITKKRDELVAEMTKLTFDEDRLETALAKIAPENWLSSTKRKMMEWPIIDGFNSHMKIRQDWLPKLHVTLGMTESARFDRCRTCHLGIDRTGSGNTLTFPFGETDSAEPQDWVAEGKYPQPFATHPRPDVYMTASSPHPLPTFGCTVCHEGQGSATSFANASHSPNDPHQEHVWAEEFDYKSNHYWEYPMYPKRFRESSCIKCHHSVIELGVNSKYGETAPKVYEGWQLVRQYGCFGCHEINGYDGGKPIGPDLRLEPSTPEEAHRIAEDPNLIAGGMRKVGPSLMHIGDKTTPGWVEYWTEEPKRFRPSTRMPQFFGLTNQTDAHAQKLTKVEIAGISQYLFDKSEPLELLQPKEGYQADATRGEQAFAQRGCLNCHKHSKFPEITAEFGPDLSKFHEKLKPGAEGSNWLYTWVRNPELHHPRTKMPNLYLEPEGTGDNYIDPAADIVAFFTAQGSQDYKVVDVNEGALNELVDLFLSKGLTRAQVESTFKDRRYPHPAELIKGDEIELVPPAEGRPDDTQWQRMKLNYVGRRTISRYGCYGCHDIKGFEEARPIGTALQDWGRKDTSKLALEHIEEFLHHHGEPDGSSTYERASSALKEASSDGFPDDETKEAELRTAFFYESLLHHGRPGFIWQKLRQPRSYDYEKIETKGYDERLRMPKFPFNEKQIEAVATFVLGLVAEPPSEDYLFQPKGPDYAVVEGERLLQKYNCIGCHMVDLPKISFAVDPDELRNSELQAGDHPQALDLLLKLKPPRNALTGQMHTVKTSDGETQLPVMDFRGLVFAKPDLLDDIEDQEYAYDLWETLNVGEKQLFPATRMLVPAAQLVERQPPRGGQFAEWLVEHLLPGRAENNRFLAWQMVPPPLYKEGIKVQTAWLYRFLKEPDRLRHTTVLRMPRFNMDDDEARALANYFSAVDGVEYPYQAIPQREPEYLEQKNAEFHAAIPNKEDDYLKESWKLLNAPICIKCHSVGGRQFQATDPKKDIRGPNLDRVTDRLRPDWTMLWLYNPRWVTPYTSMPAVFPKNQSQFPELFGGDAQSQTVGARDALMNYNRLMEQIGKYIPPTAASAAEKPGE